MTEIQLHAHVLTARAAVLAESVTIAVMAAVVILVDQLSTTTLSPWLSLHVPLIALGLGLLGAVFAGSGAVGYIRNPSYVLVYYAAIAAMIAVDLGVRWLLGGELAMVFANWAVLIGSASAINLLLTRLPVLTARHLVDETEISTFHPIALAIVVIVQVAQAAVSVLGAGWLVVIASLAARRVAILPITHLIARRNYGPDCALMLRHRETVEYCATWSVADDDGRVIEPEALERSVVGAMLLKLPMFAGEAMSAGRESLVRLGDKLVFVEQMLAFSSPTMVVSRVGALGHTAFIRMMLQKSGASSSHNPRLADREACKLGVRYALAGEWARYRETRAKTRD
ncbi:hypothetical protein G6O69_17750 [Pseudenhygromyxa sp. WMMC2535]|uniref:hypothetical protein n=1 Tax=Pseudenhygromyxa sp. WMMC2535 TaxID=2712867 RepID=UPI0015953F81|nr:hypothetical protein [Pseudenhygromyxa sp. WMMC2535]NVB39692.1 hypothetical protein [Pseudenhygromyxa sp. WMMC2535]